MLYRSSVADCFILIPYYKNLRFKVLHFFTLNGTDNYCFLGGTQYDATLQSIRHHNKLSFILRFDDVKSIVCTI